MAVHMSVGLWAVLAAGTSRDLPCHPVLIKSRASEARQAEGVAPVVKGSEVGMWSR